MLYAYFDPNSRAVLGWYDTEAFDVNLPDADLLIEVEQYQWDVFTTAPAWVDYKGELVTSQPELEVPLATAKEAKLQEISSACEAAIVEGFTCDALGSAHTYPAKDRDQANLTASVLDALIAEDEDYTTPFWCMNSEGVWGYAMHTAEQMKAVGRAGKKAIATAIGKKIVLEAKINACTDAASVQAISWDAASTTESAATKETVSSASTESTDSTTESAA